LITVYCCYKSYRKRKENDNEIMPAPIDEKTGEIKKPPTLFVEKGDSKAVSPERKEKTFGGTPPIGK
jgi:hypothetical protein